MDVKKSLVDVYLEKLSTSDNKKENELAKAAKKKRKRINSSDVYMDDPNSFVMAFVDGIYKGVIDKIDYVFRLNKRDKGEVITKCRETLDKIVSHKLRLERTDLTYEEMVEDALELNVLCNIFYNNASEMMKLEDEKSLQDEVREMYPQAEKIIDKAGENVCDIEDAVRDLLENYYRFPDEKIIGGETEWVEVNEPRLAMEFKETWQKISKLSAEILSRKSEKNMLINIVKMDKEYRNFNRLRSKIRQKRLDRKEVPYEDWRDVA